MGKNISGIRISILTSFDPQLSQKEEPCVGSGGGGGVFFLMAVKGVVCLVILLNGGGGGDVGSGESQVPKASLPSRITSSFVRHIPGRRKYDSRAARKIFTFFD